MTQSETVSAADAIAPEGLGSHGVRLTNISKVYPGGNEAVKSVSLEIEPGEVFTLLGPSGCGKTTTLRMIAGLEDLTGGSIYFGDRPVADVDKRIFVRANKRAVGMVFQSYAIWPHMTVEENVGYPLKLRGIKGAEMRRRVSAALELVGMGGLEKRPAPMLSGGQQQRVALARALVYEPTILLLDEPFSNLDAKLRDQMRVEVKMLQQRLHITVVFVTHDQVEALSLSDRIAVMNFGQVQQIGRPEILYENPANEFVRDFLGKTVLFRGTVSSSNADGEVAVGLAGAPNCTIFGRVYGRPEVRSGEPVNVAIRPEDIELTEAHGGSTPDGALIGLVEARLFVGERTEYRVSVEGQGAVLVYGRRDQIIDPGKNVWLRPHGQNAGIWTAREGATPAGITAEEQ